MTIPKKKPKPQGHPQKYVDASDLQKAIDGYFEWCEGEPYLDVEGQPITSDNGIAYKRAPQVPSVTGLAYHLGYLSRQALINYDIRAERAEANDKMSDEEKANVKALNDTISRAKLRIEATVNGLLYGRDTYKGASFTLERNFRGYIPESNINIGNKDEAFKIKVSLTDD